MASNPEARSSPPDVVSLGDVELELFEFGEGEPLLYLHGGEGVRFDLQFLQGLAASRRVIAPSHPGFGKSSLPDWLDSIDDVAHIYLELMERRGLAQVDVIGFSVGGWIAADIASKVPDRIRRLVLI